MGFWGGGGSVSSAGGAATSTLGTGRAAHLGGYHPHACSNLPTVDPERR